LSKRAPVPLGSKSDNLYADFLIVCRNVLNHPETFIAKVKDIIPNIHKGEKNERFSYWLQQKDYETYNDKWDIIGKGL